MYIIIFLLILSGCENPFINTQDLGCSSCNLEISCDLPQDEDGIYLLPFNQNMVQTFTTIYAETDCGWSQKITWDTNYRYDIGGQNLRLINNASMTDEDGSGRIIFGVWEPFIGYTIGCYGGYSDDCGNQHIDSLFIKII